jgi:UDP-N-acetylmuramate dehydrogenase
VKNLSGGGSNLLIAEREIDCVISLREFNTKLDLNEGIITVGASVRLQKLIQFANENELGGIEYLYSVPGLVGGAVVMNAGRGRKFNQSISDYIVEVRYLENDELKSITKDQCRFEYRDSIFKNNPNRIVVEVDFEFDHVSIEESAKRREDRLKLCRETQDNSGRNFGTVFMKSDGKIMNFLKKTHMHRGGASFSKITLNWIIKKDNGSYQDVKWLINRTENIHNFFGKECVPEVIIWD